MFKYFFVFLSCLLLCQNVKAQKVVDSILYYMKNSGKLAVSKDSADYFLLIMAADSTSNSMFRINEFYPNKRLKAIGTSTSAEYNNLVLNGPYVSYFPNGRKKNLCNYDKGLLSGNERNYYPNGKLYSITVYNSVNNPITVYKNIFYINIKYVQCNDSTGNVLAENGKGKWIFFDKDFKKVESEGTILDSVQNGEWRGNGLDSTSYTITFDHGKQGPGIGYDKNGNPHPFTVQDVQASFKGRGNETYSDFLRQNLKVPDINRRNGTGGKVIINFIVEKDGTTSNFKVLRTPDQSLADESLRVVSLMIWNPGLQYGMPVRSYFTLPINFTVTNGR